MPFLLVQFFRILVIANYLFLLKAESKLVHLKDFQVHGLKKISTYFKNTEAILKIRD